MYPSWRQPLCVVTFLGSRTPEQHRGERRTRGQDWVESWIMFQYSGWIYTCSYIYSDSSLKQAWCVVCCFLINPDGSKYSGVVGNPCSKTHTEYFLRLKYNNQSTCWVLGVTWSMFRVYLLLEYWNCSNVSPLLRIKQSRIPNFNICSVLGWYLFQYVLRVCCWDTETAPMCHTSSSSKSFKAEF